MTARLVDGNPLFFPLDGVADMITPSSEYALARVPPWYGTAWTPDPSEAPHNFYFTSEARFWFLYTTESVPSLEFAGDDDVWVFVNRQLTIDLGGIHVPVSGRVTFTSDGNASVAISQTEPDPPRPAVIEQVPLGLEDGRVYEIAVFQAERHTAGSSYNLHLPAFNFAATRCGPE